MKKKTVAGIIVTATTAVLLLAGCGREVDAGAVGAEDVPGTHGLKRFCDQSTLIYFSDWGSSDDDYEWFYPGGCAWDEKTQKWVFANPAPQPTVGDSTGTGEK